VRSFALGVSLSLLLAVLISGSAAGAAAAVDQHQTKVTGSEAGYIFLGQTFTVGMTGKITGVSLKLSCSPDTNITAALATVAPNNTPTTAYLTTGLTHVTTAKAYYIAFPTPQHVTTGESWSFVVGVPSGCSISTATGNPYVGGMLWIDQKKGAGWVGHPNEDAYFMTSVLPDLVKPITTLAHATATSTGTPAPTQATAATSTPGPTDTAAASAAASESGVPEATESPLVAAVTASGSAGASVVPAPGAPVGPSGGSDGTPLLLVGALGGALLVLLAVGAGFLLGRRGSRATGGSGRAGGSV
jgi:hypothetical protein